MARKYKVKGTNDYLIAAILLFALGVWAIRDGWYPSQRTLDKYPIEVPLQFEIEGEVAEVSAREGGEVAGNQVVARLWADPARRRVAEEEEALAEAVAANGARAEELRRSVDEARAYLAQHELRAPSGGVIRAVLVERSDTVGPEDTVAVLDPLHRFYPFNRILAVVSMLAAAACLVIHLKVR